ncbi:tail assembly protein [Entomohabitans teleogrylli]|uniref:tail assembly protein n=1 Tax=Entomohabitans teleogrylli TaxID=1384589 RepID=UPI00073D361A|nr:tail assembly protein [Entomohabitans teleogrylli]
MQETMTRIELGGALGKRFGKVHQRVVRTRNEAVRALCCTLDGFEQFLNRSKQQGLTYAVFSGGKNINLEEMPFPAAGETIRIVPVIIGSKRAGGLQTILGAVLVAVSLFVPGGVIASGGLAAAGAWGSTAMLGASMMLGGVVQLLFPQPTGLAMSPGADNKASYAFGGVTNTTAQGYPVPLLYGKRRIGGAIISAGIYVEEKQ